MCDTLFKINCLQSQQSCHSFKNHSCIIAYLYDKAFIITELVTFFWGEAKAM